MTPTQPDQGDWDITLASVQGKSHLEGGQRNQDWVEYRASADGQVIVAVVSDGAGSAERSHLGAMKACELMVPCLLAIGGEMLYELLDAATARKKVAEGLDLVREALGSTGEPLHLYHCTFVACVIAPAGAYVFQIGDSIGVSSTFAELGEGGTVDFFPDESTHIFEGERGEYANETHFITEDDWIAHLRVTACAPGMDALLLMTDGAMDVALARGQVFRGFLSNLVGKLLALPSQALRNERLESSLADPRTYKLTGDDKTMFVAIREARRGLAKCPIQIHSDPNPYTELMPDPLQPKELSGRPLTGLILAAPALAQKSERPMQNVRAGVRLMSARQAALACTAFMALGLVLTAAYFAFRYRKEIHPIRTIERLTAIQHPLPVGAKPSVQPEISAVSSTKWDAEVVRRMESPSSDPGLPQAVTSTGALVAFMPNSFMEIAMRPGSTVDVEIILASGAEIELKSMRTPENWLASAGDPLCGGVLDATSRTCKISIKTPIKVQEGRHIITLIFNERGKKLKEVMMAVRVGNAQK